MAEKGEIKMMAECNYKVISKTALQEFLEELKEKGVVYVCSTYGIVIYRVQGIEHVVYIR